MIFSYLKTSLRNIARNKLFSFINIVGLAISMSVGLVVIALLTDLVSYDKFHSKGKGIYRVIDTVTRSGSEAFDVASTSIKAGRQIESEIAGVEKVVILRRGFSGDAHFKDKYIPTNGLWATQPFFDIFDFKLLEGDPKTALKEPYSIVLTKETATKLFGSDQALGKTILFDTIAYEVKGVMEDIPYFSHMRFESLVSLSTFEVLNQKSPDLFKWGSVWMNYVYLLLPENADANIIQQNLTTLSQRENKAVDNIAVSLKLQPLDEIVMGQPLSNQIGPTMDRMVLYVMGGLAFIVILSACFNYTNLSVARSLRRSREIGIRKVIGAKKRHVIMQFISEAVVISFMALTLAFVMFRLMKPHFLSLAPEWYQVARLELSTSTLISFALLALLVGVFAGLLPALFFAKVNATVVLRNVGSIKVFRNLTLRKTLIVAQYTISIMFIAATVIGYKQYTHFLNFDLGFQTENILNVRLQGNRADIVSKALEPIPEVSGISKSQMVTSVGSYWGSMVKYTNEKDSAAVFYNSIDERYLPLHGHKLLAGRNLNFKAENAEESEVIVNEQLLKRFEIGKGDPEKALGEEISVDGKKLTIVGVMRDFHYGKVDSELVPVFFRYYDDKRNNGLLNVKISTTDIASTMARIESAWKDIDRIHPLNATFYDDDIEKAYSEISAIIKMIAVLATLAISIASLGLLGMVVFTTESRLREISVRKVLGASEGSLIVLLSRGFILLLAIAATVALPVTYWLFDSVFLASVAYRAPIGFIELFSGVFLVLGLALLMIWTQTWKVARANPAEVLKAE